MLFSNKEQVRVFFEAVANIGTTVIPVDEQVGLAQQIIQRAADWPGRPREVSTTFIREQISDVSRRTPLDAPMKPSARRLQTAIPSNVHSRCCTSSTATLSASRSKVTSRWS